MCSDRVAPLRGSEEGVWGCSPGVSKTPPPATVDQPSGLNPGAPGKAFQGSTNLGWQTAEELWAFFSDLKTSQWHYLFLLILTTPALAAEPLSTSEPRALLIDDQLATRSIIVLSLDERVLAFVDEQQRQRTLARPSILALIPEQTPERIPQRNRSLQSLTTGLLELTDAQRFEGDLLPTGGSDQSLAWTHPTLGQLIFPIEKTWSFWRPAAPENLRTPITTAPKYDTLFLNNQDQLTGFLASAGDPIRIETESGINDLPPERVVGAQLSNPRESPAGTRVWLDGGTVATVDHITIDASLRSTFTVANGTIASINWTQLRAIAFDSARLLPLSGITPTSQSPAKGRRHAPPIKPSVQAPLDARDLLLPGPMSITWQLPEGSRRIAFTASLAEGSEPWGDCDLIVTIDGSEYTRRRLSTENPTAPLTFPVNGQTLAITIDPGKFGPIRDWVVLTRPLILIAPPAEHANE